MAHTSIRSPSPTSFGRHPAINAKELPTARYPSAMAAMLAIKVRPARVMMFPKPLATRQLHDPAETPQSDENRPSGRFAAATAVLFVHGLLIPLFLRADRGTTANPPRGTVPTRILYLLRLPRQHPQARAGS